MCLHWDHCSDDYSANIQITKGKQVKFYLLLKNSVENYLPSKAGNIFDVARGFRARLPNRQMAESPNRQSAIHSDPVTRDLPTFNASLSRSDEIFWLFSLLLLINKQMTTMTNVDRQISMQCSIYKISTIYNASNQMPAIKINSLWNRRKQAEYSCSVIHYDVHTHTHTREMPLDIDYSNQTDSTRCYIYGGPEITFVHVILLQIISTHHYDCALWIFRSTAPQTANSRNISRMCCY